MPSRAPLVLWLLSHFSADWTCSSTGCVRALASGPAAGFRALLEALDFEFAIAADFGISVFKWLPVSVLDS